MGAIDRFFNTEVFQSGRAKPRSSRGEQQSGLGLNVQQREPFLMDWGEMNFGRKGRKEVYILRRREMVKTRFPSGALDSEYSTGVPH
jgi:hypothetical protein